MSYSINYNNKVVTPAGTVLNVRPTPGVSGTPLFQVTAGQAAGRTNGMYLAMNDGNWLQVMFYDSQRKQTGKEYGYVRSDVVTLSTPDDSGKPVPSVKDTQSLLDSLNESDRKLAVKIVNNYAGIQKLADAGKDYSDEQARVRRIITSFMERRSNLKNSPLLKVRDTLTDLNTTISAYGTPAFGADVANFMATMNGVGAIPLIVLDYVMIGIASIALYLMFAGMGKQSALDNQWSDDLDKILQQKLNTTQYAQLNKEKDALIKKAYVQGKKDGGGFMDNLKGIAIAAAVGIGLWKIPDLISSRSKK